MPNTCKYCGGKIRRKKFETNDLYAARQYCDQPKCLREGRQERLEALYAKDEPEAMRNHRQAFITRALFLLRWGMEPMEAFDKYGREASKDWEDLMLKVKEGKGVRFLITVEVFDGGEKPISSVTEEEHVIFDDQQSTADLISVSSDMALAAHKWLLGSDE